MTALRGTEIELVAAERGDGGAEDGAASRFTPRPRFSLVRWGGAGDPSRNARPEPLLSVRGGVTRPSLRLAQGRGCGRVRAARGVLMAGCGGGEGVASGCDRDCLRAKRRCARRRSKSLRGKVGELESAGQAACLPSARAERRSSDLATRRRERPQRGPRTRPRSPTWKRRTRGDSLLAPDPRRTPRSRWIAGKLRASRRWRTCSSSSKLALDSAPVAARRIAAVGEASGGALRASSLLRVRSRSAQSASSHVPVPELVPEVQRPALGITRWPPLRTTPNSLPNIRSSDEPGNRHHRGPAQRSAERLREVLVGHRVGRGRVDDAADLSLSSAQSRMPDLVVDVDPGDVLVAAGQRSADARA